MFVRDCIDRLTNQVNTTGTLQLGVVLVPSNLLIIVSLAGDCQVDQVEL